MRETDGVPPDRVRAIDVFSEPSEDDLRAVASLASPRSYDEGQEMLHHGTWPEDLLALAHRAKVRTLQRQVP